MEKERVHISECTDGHVLAEDIFNHKGMLILSAGTVCNPYILKRLNEYGVEYIWVSAILKTTEPLYTDYHIFESKYKKSIYDMKNLIQELAKGKKVDYSAVSNISKAVLSAGNEPEHIIKCMRNIQDSDDYTYHHCINVSFYAMLIGGWINLAREDIKILIQAGLLHDIGKAKISDKLLNKMEKLSAQEFDEIKRHAIYGYELIKDIPEISEEIKDAVLMHHEREDGSGYPLHAGGDDLSIYSKIIAVADVFDAMTSSRPYKKALTPFNAFEEILTCRGQLEIHIVNTLLYNLSRCYLGSSVLLSNGKTGNIVYVPPHSISKPVVDTGNGFLDMSRENEISIVGMV